MMHEKIQWSMPNQSVLFFPLTLQIYHFSLLWLTWPCSLVKECCLRLTYLGSHHSYFPLHLIQCSYYSKNYKPPSLIKNIVRSPASDCSGTSHTQIIFLKSIQNTSFKNHCPYRLISPCHSSLWVLPHPDNFWTSPHFSVTLNLYFSYLPLQAYRSLLQLDFI